MSYVVMVCAVLASLATGVLLAHGVCQTMFALFQMHARQVAGRSQRPAVVRQIAEG